MTVNEYNYLFVSDMHVAHGYDEMQRSYHPREDFLYDTEFYNFLHWADKHPEGGKKWELVIVGDAFDFLPVEIEAVEENKRINLKLIESLTEPDPDQRKAILDDFLYYNNVPEEIRRKTLIEYRDLGLLAVGKLPKKDTTTENARLEETLGWSRVPDAFLDLFLMYDIDSTGELGIRVNQHQSFVRSAAMKLKFNLRVWLRWGKRDEFENFFLTEAGAISKLQIICKGHKKLVEGFAWWVSQGHRLVILPGNHDLELRWEGVKQKFKEILTEIFEAHPEWKKDSSLAQDFMTRIVLDYNWFYFKNSVFYAEHGDQYDALNNAHNVFEPYLPDFGNGKPRQVLLPYGSLGVWMLVGRFEDEFPQFEILGDHAGAIKYYFRKYRFQVLRLLAKNGLQYAWMGWQAVLSTTGDNVFAQLFRSTQLMLIGFLHWFMHGLWRHLSKWSLRIRYAIAHILEALSAHPLQMQSLLLWLRKSPPLPQYYPEGFWRKILCKLVFLNPDVADKIYASWYPTKEQFAAYALRFKLSPSIVEDLYSRWDQPATMYRLPMFIYLVLYTLIIAIVWFVNILSEILLWVFNPLAGLLPLITIVWLLWEIRPESYTQLAENLGSLWLRIRGIPESISPVLKSFFDQPNLLNIFSVILGTILLMLLTGGNEMIKRLRAFLDIKLFNYFIDPHDYILEGAKGVQKVLEGDAARYGDSYIEDPIYGNIRFKDAQLEQDYQPPRFYIMGHDHRPAVHLLSKLYGANPSPGDGDEDYSEGRNRYGHFAYYYNTGSWLPQFSDQDIRRVRTGGLDNEFTFLKIYESGKDKLYGTSQYEADFLRWNDALQQPQEQIEIHTHEKKKRTRILGGSIGIGGTIGLVAAIVGKQFEWINLAVYVAIGLIVGSLIEIIIRWINSKIYP